MNTLHIVTDSNCHIPSALCHELGITVVPLPFVWDGVTYLDAIDMRPAGVLCEASCEQDSPEDLGAHPRIIQGRV